MDNSFEVPISLTPLLVIIGAVAAAIALFLRRRPIALVSALVAVAALGYAVIWTLLRVLAAT